MSVRVGAYQWIIRKAIIMRRERDEARRQLARERQLHHSARTATIRLTAEVAQLRETNDRLTTASVARDFTGPSSGWRRTH